MKRPSRILISAAIVLTCVLFAMSRPTNSEGSQKFSIFVSSVDPLKEFHRDFDRVRREGGCVAVYDVEVACVGRKRSFLKANTTEKFLKLDESDCFTRRITISPRPDDAADGFMWNAERVEELVQFLNDTGVEGLEGVNTVAMLHELSARRPYILDIDSEKSRTQRDR